MKSLIPLCLASLTTVLSAQPWTFEACIQQGHSNNIAIKRSELQTELARKQRQQACASLLPNLWADANRNYRFGRQVNPTTNEFENDNFINDQYSVVSGVNLFTGLRLYHTLQKSRFDYLAAQEHTLSETMDLTLQITSAFLEILYQQDLVTLAGNQQQQIAFQVQRTQRMVETGSAAPGELLEMHAQQARENLKKTTSENNLQLALLQLAQLMNLDTVSGFEIVRPDSTHLILPDSLPSAWEVFQSALSVMPQIREAEFLLQSSKKELAIQRGRISPSVYVQASLFTVYSDQTYANQNTASSYRNQINENLAQSVGIGIHLPLFNRLEIRQGVCQARIQSEDFEFRLIQNQQDLLQQIQQAHNDVSTGIKHLEAAKQTLISEQQNYNHTRQRLLVGLASSLEYSVSKNRLIEGETEVLRARYELLFAVKILELYQGNTIRM